MAPPAPATASASRAQEQAKQRAKKRDGILVALAHYLAAGIAVLAGAIGVGGLVPPWNTAMIGVHIVASECGLWEIAALLVALALANLPPCRPWPRALTSGIAAGAIVLALVPYVQLDPAVRVADREMSAVCGRRWEAVIPADELAVMRSAPFTLSAAIDGIPLSEGTSDGTGSDSSVPPIAIRAVSIPGGDGVALTGLVYRSQANSTAAATVPGKAVIVVIHGGGWRRGGVTEAADCNRYLAAHGYVVYSIAYRFAPTTHFPGQLDDVSSALAWIGAHARDDGGDASRIILMGRSAGAQLAQVAAYTAAVSGTQPAIKGVIAWYSPIDMATAVTNPSHPDPLDAGHLMIDYLGGTPDQVPDRYRDASPLSYAMTGLPLPPLMLIAGRRDHAVLIGYQHEYHERLRSTGHLAALIEIPWAEHACDLVSDGPSAQFGLFYLERFAAWALHRDDPQPPDRWTRPR